jgi:hypothetical protein
MMLAACERVPQHDPIEAAVCRREADAAHVVEHHCSAVGGSAGERQRQARIIELTVVIENTAAEPIAGQSGNLFQRGVAPDKGRRP